MHPALQGFAAYRQFIVYRTEASASRPGKTDKFPIDTATGWKANAHDSSIWMDEQTAKNVASQWGEPYGVGFVFTEADPFWFLDIDGALIDGQWSPLALQLCNLFPGCAVEVSPSGTGLHIYGTGAVPAHGCKNELLGIEFYHTGRFATITEAGIVGNCLTDASQALPHLVATYFPPKPEVEDAEWTSKPCEGWNGPSDDTELIRRAMQSQSVNAAFGHKASFADLWLANEDMLAKTYPDPERLSGYNASVADRALAQHLAFWTGRDCERIQRLMWQSKLVRDKWERDDYLPRTILGAVAVQFDVLQDKVAPSPSITVGDAPEENLQRPGDGFMNSAQQVEYFKGCVYIRSTHRALIPGGIILKPEQFKVHYGGYVFNMDLSNDKTTRDAWEAWTQSQVYKPVMVDGTCFKPNLAPGEIHVASGQRFVNTYFPVPIQRQQGDARPFLDHLAKVLPDKRDQQILLSYMAACVQHQGVKFQWAPLLQGVEGNGKTLFTRCVAEAIGRRYVHWPKASKIAAQFNSWMVGKIFFAVEDIYVPDARREIIEELKPMITGGDGLEIEAKGVDQISVDVCGNFMFNSNHKAAIQKTRNDRRFCVLFCAQQEAEHLVRDGLSGDYFPNLYKWLREGGYAVISDYLHTYSIPAEYNPAGDCQRAPKTTSTEEAIAASSGNLEQEIEESIAQGLQGFAGGWVSSIFLARMLENLGLARKVGPYRRKEILEQMGYCYHPALTDGRVNNVVIPDNGKPRLFVRKDSMHMQLREAAQVAKAYEDANKNRSAAVALPFALNRA